MKDIVISVKRQKKELITFSVCLAVAFAMNVYAIAVYGGDWNELFWSLGFVITAAVIIYFLWSVMRLIFYFVKSLFKH